ncbi:DNA repair protein RecN [Dendrosporobacter sp. 1207_IL3150]|uniref:DNA repair protein RecN n=1 Tax=Dendrosporobacter sp. 1207_IL3150 TaxID=3084054 RepID=UPI002FDA771D
MLKTLTVSNFALIEYADISFTDGLNILTGETGAGKSILIDAFSVILGSRASVDYIRKDTDALRVEAVFDITGNNSVITLLAEQDVTPEEDGTLILSRRLSRNGKNTITINGCHITLAFLRQLGECLVDMHGQHENQSLLRSETHFDILDSYSKNIREKLQSYRDVYHEWLKIGQELSKKESQSRERNQRLDMMKWQTEEIAAACLKQDEEIELEQEVKILANSEKIVNSLNKAYTYLNNNSKGYVGVLTGLADAKRELEIAVRYNPEFQPQLKIVIEALFQLEECSRDIRDFSDNLEFNSHQLAQLQERLDLIYKLSKKYGPTTKDILDYYDQALQELSELISYDEIIADMSNKKKLLEKSMLQLAQEISTMREANSEKIAEEIQNHLIHLGMPKARLYFNIKRLEKYTPNGFDDIEVLFSANPGEEPKAIQKVASGGELSRLALAIKAVNARHDNVSTMVFDEIDTGIGGKTAQMVAERIAMVAAYKQVLCITHLPQIAAMADVHIYIEKHIEEEKTLTKIKTLNENEQITELARMVSGNVTQVAKDNSAQMLNAARELKEKWKNKA